jgi:hypothetical protein
MFKHPLVRRTKCSGVIIGTFALSRELALEEAVDLSHDRLCIELKGLIIGPQTIYAD